jgi:hypothetical protein
MKTPDIFKPLSKQGIDHHHISRFSVIAVGQRGTFFQIVELISSNFWTISRYAPSTLFRKFTTMTTATMTTTAIELAASMLNGDNYRTLTSKQLTYLRAMCQRDGLTRYDRGYFIGPYQLTGQILWVTRSLLTREQQKAEEARDALRADDLAAFVARMRGDRTPEIVNASKRFAAARPAIAQAFWNVRDEIDDAGDRQLVAEAMAALDA